MCHSCEMNIRRAIDAAKGKKITKNMIRCDTPDPINGETCEYKFVVSQSQKLIDQSLIEASAYE